jgi:dihydroorotase
MKATLIFNAHIINEDQNYIGYVLIKGETIALLGKGSADEVKCPPGTEKIDASGLLLIPGAIDDQVHFREPGLTHKGSIYTESRAAIAGGITSYFEMPNTVPAATTINLLNDKYVIASEKSFANYAFFMGASNNNLDQLLRINSEIVPGVKIFMGSSTGSLLVDNEQALADIFREIKLPIAVHCEDDALIAQNFEREWKQYGENIPIHRHPIIRNHEACYKSSSKAVELASKFNARLHVLHISTERELALFQNNIPLNEKRITAEACVHHLWFCDDDYEQLGSRIKWNPAIKTKQDRTALREALLNGKIDVLATDHAPHTLEEKKNAYRNCPSGGPLVQHALPALFDLVEQGYITYERVVQLYCHNPAILFQVLKRGFIREGYFADLVLVNPKAPQKVTDVEIQYACGWSPFSGHTFSHSINKTFVNGHKVYDRGVFDEIPKGKCINFDRS